MLHPLKMQKVRIYSLASAVSSVIGKLHTLGVMEIVVSENNSLRRGAPLESFNEISAQLVRIRAIKANLLKKDTGTLSEVPDAVKEAKEITVDERLRSIYTDISKIESDISKINEELRLTKQLGVFSSIDFSKLGSKTTSYLLGSAPAKNLQQIRDMLSKSEAKKKASFALSEKEAFILILCEKGTESEIESSILRLGFVKIDPPANLTTTEKYAFWLERELRNKKAQLAQLKPEIDSISDRYYKKVANLEYSLAIAADRAEISSRFSFGKSFVLIEGWTQSKTLDTLEHGLKEFGDNVFVEKALIGHNDIAPTVLENLGVVKPYQFLTESYSFPNSSEFDPSIIFFFTIPLLYGMIVGDVIYGLISIFLAIFFMKKFKGSEVLSSISRLWLFSAIPAIIFGFLFDEFAGMSHYHLLEVFEKWHVLDLNAIGITAPLYLGLSRLHNLTSVLQLTLMVGMIHLALGLVMGAINEWNHSKKHSLGKIAWIGVEIGGYITVATFLFSAMPASAGNVGVGILAVSIAVIAWAEGVVGILELPGIAGNVFSYMRIAVVGVVGTILAELINVMFMPAPEQGIMALIFFPLFLLLHVFNAFIAMFEAVIQGGRLNIIEFKLKFLKGGGRPFRPFALKNMR